MLEAHPEAATVQGKYGKLPLHYAAGNQAPVEVAQAILAAHPEAAKVQILQILAWENGCRFLMPKIMPVALGLAAEARAAEHAEYAESGKSFLMLLPPAGVRRM